MRLISGGECVVAKSEAFFSLTGPLSVNVVVFSSSISTACGMNALVQIQGELCWTIGISNMKPCCTLWGQRGDPAFAPVVDCVDTSASAVRCQPSSLVTNGLQRVGDPVPSSDA